jgi:nucleoside-diphosphate-sugar epimerase
LTTTTTSTILFFALFNPSIYPSKEHGDDEEKSSSHNDYDVSKLQSEQQSAFYHHSIGLAPFYIVGRKKHKHLRDR